MRSLRRCQPQRQLAMSFVLEVGWGCSTSCVGLEVCVCVCVNDTKVGPVLLLLLSFGVSVVDNASRRWQRSRRRRKRRQRSRRRQMSAQFDAISIFVVVVVVVQEAKRNFIVHRSFVHCCCCYRHRLLLLLMPQVFAKFSVFVGSQQRVGGAGAAGVVVVVFKDMKSGDISSAISGIGFVVFSTLVICWLC